MGWQRRVLRWRGVASSGPRPIRGQLATGVLGVLLVVAAALVPRPPSAEAGAVVEEPARSNVVFEAWEESVRERELTAVAGVFAQRFRISPELATRIYTAAAAESIRPDVAFGLIRAESSFRPRVVSPAGAVGLTQVLPSTGRWIVPGTTRSDLMDPDTNLRVGFRYLRYLLEKYNGNEKLALTAYNRGPGTVDRELRRGRNPDNGYVEMVLTGHSRRHTTLMNQRFGPGR
jgi:soluble lytic murein transglycosylase-like protein